MNVCIPLGNKGIFSIWSPFDIMGNHQLSANSYTWIRAKTYISLYIRNTRQCCMHHLYLWYADERYTITWSIHINIVAETKWVPFKNEILKYISKCGFTKCFQFQIKFHWRLFYRLYQLAQMSQLFNRCIEFRKEYLPWSLSFWRITAITITY